MVFWVSFVFFICKMALDLFFFWKSLGGVIDFFEFSSALVS